MIVIATYYLLHSLPLPPSFLFLLSSIFTPPFVSTCVCMQYNAQQILITVLVVLYGIRLAGYLLLRILKTGKDARFDGIRENPFKFLVFFLLQIVWVYVVSLPVLFINSPVLPQIDVGAAGIVGAILFAFGLLYETIVDQHKYTFWNNPKNRGKFIRSGLWALSRHPNYFGEICVWWGAFVMSCTILRRARWVAVVSPLFITGLLIFGSGMPTTERSADRKYGKWVRNNDVGRCFKKGGHRLELCACTITYPHSSKMYVPCAPLFLHIPLLYITLIRFCMIVTHPQ